MSLYSNVLKQSWFTVWRRKRLWLIGILAILFGASIEVELLESFLSTNKNTFYTFNSFFTNGIFNSALLSNVKTMIATDSYAFAVVISSFIVFLLVLLGIIIFAVMAQIIIIDHSAQMRIKVNAQPKIIQTIAKKWRKLLAIITLDFSIKIVVYISFLIIALPIFLTITTPSIVADSFYLLLFVLILPISIVFAFVVKYIISYIVIYDQKLLQAIRNGWLLFKENWLVSIEMSFILFLINVFGSLGIIFIIYIIGIPLKLLTEMGGLTIAPVILIIGTLASFGIYLIIFLLGGGLFTSYTITAWTNLFLQLNEKSGTSKIARTVAKLSNK